jgi:hypothetical protein
MAGNKENRCEHRRGVDARQGTLTLATLRHVRALVLSLPESTEEDHHGMPSFRVRGRIFATVPDNAHLRVMADEPEILAACAEEPEACAPGYWGRRLAFVLVTLRNVPAPLLAELVTDAWAAKAPQALQSIPRGPLNGEARESLE